MPMPIEQAKIILNEYRKTGYNKSKALKNLGYSDSVANRSSKNTINSAYKAVAREIISSKDASVAAATIFDMVGITDVDALGEYLKIIKQDKDLTNKLKALMPLLKEKGIVWQDEAVIAKPTVNLTMIKNDSIIDTDVVDKVKEIRSIADITPEDIGEPATVPDDQPTVKVDDVTIN